jgi:hypothetical protein
MVKESKTGRAGAIAERKSAWSRPALTRIQASEAEVFTRVVGDGNFSTS